jgi:apolipoprotein N-acyltransferase
MKLGLAALSGLLLILCFPKADLGPLAFAALTPFLLSFPFERSRAAFGYGFLSGFVFFSGLLYWVAVFTHHVIGWLGVVAWLGLAGVQALYVGLFAVAVNLLWTRTTPLSRLFLLPSLWTLCEWARQLGSLGMGWGDLAYTQWHFLPILQIAPLAGCWAITWLIVLVNSALAMPSRKTLGIAGSIAAAAFIWGFLAPSHSFPGPKFAAAAIQANINQDVPWSGGRPKDPVYFTQTMATFERMIVDARHHTPPVGLCVLSETAVPGYPRFDPELRREMLSWATVNNVALAAGARDFNQHDGNDSNTLFVVTPSGAITGEYAKQQLVPFGEYVPFHKILPFLDKLHVAVFDDDRGGPDQPPLWAGPDIGKVGSAICYESTYPRFLRQQTKAGANVLDVITDDTWFGRTAAAKQHLAMSAMRAAETHRYLVRCAATGISAIFAPNGREMTEAPLFTQAEVIGEIAPLKDITPFVRYGDWFIWLCAVIVLFDCVRAVQASRTTGKTHNPD